MRVVRRALRRGARLCVRGLRAHLLRRVRAARRRALPLLLRSAAPPQLNAPRRARYNQRPAQPPRLPRAAPACPDGKPLHAPRVRGAEKGAQKPSGECRRAGDACKVFRKIFRQKVGYPSGMMP